MPDVPLDLSLPEFQDRVAAGAPMCLVDCREQWEWDLVRLPGARLLPLGELQERASELPTDVPVVVYCHHGVRSRTAALILRAHGLTGARSLAGGIDRYSVVVDPSLPRY